MPESLRFRRPARRFRSFAGSSRDYHSFIGGSAEMSEHSPHDAHEHGEDRHGARQPRRFDPKRAARLNDPTRLAYLPPDRIFALLAAPQGGRVADFGTGTGL